MIIVSNFSWTAVDVAVDRRPNLSFTHACRSSKPMKCGTLFLKALDEPDLVRLGKSFAKTTQEFKQIQKALHCEMV